MNETKWVKQEDVDRMIAALESFKGAEWWYRTENKEGDSRCLSPLVLQNMKLQFDNGTLELNHSKFKNLLITAIHYQMRYRQLLKETESQKTI